MPKEYEVYVAVPGKSPGDSPEVIDGAILMVFWPRHLRPGERKIDAYCGKTTVVEEGEAEIYETKNLT